MKVRRIYFDMDGVLADFGRGVRELCHMEPPPQDGPKDLDEKMWARIRKIGNFYDRLELMPGAKDMFDRIRAQYGDRVEILTGVPKKDKHIPTAGADKTSWVRRLLSEDVKMNIVKREEKQNYCSGDDCILIDDLEKNIREWEAMGGIGIWHKSAKETLAELERLGILQAE